MLKFYNIVKENNTEMELEFINDVYFLPEKKKIPAPN